MSRYDSPPAVPVSRAEALIAERNVEGNVLVGREGELYRPEEIGLSALESGVQTSVIGEFRLSVATYGDPGAQVWGPVAILRLVDEAGGAVRYGIRGLEVHAGGAARVVPGMDLIDVMPEGLVLGREADMLDPDYGDPAFISADRIWGSGTMFGANTSRRHVWLYDRGDAVLVSNKSGSGTFVAGSTPAL